MSKFIEVTTRNKMLINVSEIACIEPCKDFNIEGCMITLIHTTKRFTEGRKIFIKETYNEVKKLIQGKVMKVYVVSICKDSHKTNNEKAWEEGQKEIKRVQSGVLRIFTSKNGAKKYIEDFYNDRATNNASLEQNEKKDGSTYFASLLDSYFESDDKAATYDGISLKDCNTTISIKVNQMIVTEDTDYTDLDDDMYDIFAGEETDRAFEI